MLKVIYYNNGFKIMANYGEDNKLKKSLFYVFRLQHGKYTRVHGRRGSGAVSGVFCASFPLYDSAVDYIKKSGRKSHHRQPE